MSLLTSINQASSGNSYFAPNGSGSGGGSVTSITGGSGITATTPVPGNYNISANIVAGTNVSFSPAPGFGITINATGAIAEFPSILSSSFENYPPGIATAIWWEGQNITSQALAEQPATVILFDTTGPGNLSSITLPPTIVAGLASGNYHFMDVWGSIPMIGSNGLASGWNYACDFYCAGLSAVGPVLAPNNFYFPPLIQPSVANAIGNTFPFFFMLRVGAGEAVPTTETELQFFIQQKSVTSGYITTVAPQTSQLNICINYLLHN
jgi:hypothetical protein